ncbi:MAG TPA: divalent-cation tolerance protein CutA [Verrucomicrobiota bacterium]|nr:divalent-cation tolerance protein CutA [Verrucomicrobiales bacterium]HRI13584.1 divalent-cation tolerance protein CutA [Verrucomicrobiota bacterium]
MQRTSQHRVVLVTAPDLETARSLARSALTERLVACGNLIPQLESHYWWQGKIESSSEVLIVFKTTSSRLAALERLIVDEHPYDTPELVVLGLQSGNAKYLQWLADSVSSGAGRKAKSRSRPAK